MAVERCVVLNTAGSAVANVILADPAAYKDPSGGDVLASADAGIGWAYASGTLTALAAPAQTQAQLVEQLVAGAQAASAAVTAQVVPDTTHQIAYANALALVGPGAVVPTADPAKTAFTAMATANGFGSNLQGFATLAVEIASASLTLSSTLTALEAASVAATTPAQLATALTAFETGIEALVTTLNGAGLTVTIATPPAITIVGINA